MDSRSIESYYHKSNTKNTTWIWVGDSSLCNDNRYVKHAFQQL